MKNAEIPLKIQFFVCLYEMANIPPLKGKEAVNLAINGELQSSFNKKNSTDFWANELLRLWNKALPTPLLTTYLAIQFF